MTLAELKTAIAALSIPYAYGYFEGEQPTKYIVYNEELRNCIYADGVVVYSEPTITLQLISRHRDLTAEAAITKMLDDNQISYDFPEFYYDEEQSVHVASFVFRIGG